MIHCKKSKDIYELYKDKPFEYYNILKDYPIKYSLWSIDDKPIRINKDIGLIGSTNSIVFYFRAIKDNLNYRLNSTNKIMPQGYWVIMPDFEGELDKL